MTGGAAVRMNFGGSESRKLIGRAAFVGAALFLLCILQTTVLGRWKLFGAVPDLMLCATVLLGYCNGREEGAIGGIAAGTLSAMLGSVGVTVAPVFYMAVGYVSGYFARAVYPKSFMGYLLFLAVSLPFGAMRTLIDACMTYGNPRPVMLLLHAILPGAAGTALCGAALFFPLRWLLEKRTRRRGVKR